MATELKGVPVAPLTGILDVRSQPDLMPNGSLRYRSNIQTINERTVRRGFGWSKLFSQSPYNNSDFHDQLLLFGGTVREPATMLYEVESSRKVRSLFLGTQSRIVVLNQYSGNWRILGSGFGGGAGADCSGTRFQCSVLGDYAFFTNGIDSPQYHVLEQIPNGDGYSLTPMYQTGNDLYLIGLSSAKKTWVWKNVLFFANVVMDGSRLSYRIVWSDYNDPTSFDPSKIGTIAGFQDLDFGETVLGGSPSGDAFIIYTNKAMWLMYVNQSSDTNAPPFGFKKLPGITQQQCLFYENTLINVGDGHFYMGKDRMYFFNQYIGLPQPLEFIHSAAGLIYDNIRSDVCTANVASFCNEEVVVSVLTHNSTNSCPDISLRINKIYKTVDVIDAGFTALCAYRPQNVPTLRDWIVDQRICDPATMVANGYGWNVNKEGLPYPLPTPSAPFQPLKVYTTVTQVINGITLEDWNQPTASANSLCALISQTEYGNLRQYCTKCESAPVLVASSSQDWCLKQFGDAGNPIFYRERCTNPTNAGTAGSLGYTSSVGSYLLDGYDSIIRFAPAFFSDGLVIAERLQLNYTAAPSPNPAKIHFRVGVAGQVADPNTDNCFIRWFDLSAKDLKCLNQFVTQKQYADKNASPNSPLWWNFIYSGRYIYFEIKITGIGGDALLSGVVGSIRGKTAKNY